MKQHNYNQIETKSILETDVSSALRSIDPSYENANSWYTSQKPVLRNKKSKSYFTVPLFGSVFATVIAFVMIFSTDSSNQNTVAMQDGIEIASFAMNTNTLTPREIGTVSTDVNARRQEPAERILSKIDQSILASSRVQTETFTAMETDESLNVLFE